MVFPWGFRGSAIGLNICAIPAGIKNTSKKKKKRKNHNKTVLLAKSKLNSTEVLISKALIVSNVSYDEFVLKNNVLKEHGNMKEETKNLKT